eukprot:CAMPEP_0170184328 /NCGR_PEP_ID=MMETSP0040_2-20121228/33358_1 /TAXON_ID=641309 /ORGANISM="Lotharella oceanica, Strain CCMP622" /LENGTH=312 /DNA_ID=CAMNT_0010430363 /DNA_START=145 /DNA_END=1083 /DNA_ORIENTATION=-
MDDATSQMWVRITCWVGVTAVGVNAVQGGLAFWMGMALSSSIAMVNFGLESYVEVLSGILLLSRLLAKNEGFELAEPETEEGSPVDEEWDNAEEKEVSSEQAKSIVASIISCASSRTTPAKLERRREMADRGYLLLIGILLAVIGLATMGTAIFATLHPPRSPSFVSSTPAERNARETEVVVSFVACVVLAIISVFKIKAATVLRSTTLWNEASWSISRVMLASILFVSCGLRLAVPEWWWIDNLASVSMSLVVLGNGGAVVKYAVSEHFEANFYRLYAKVFNSTTPRDDSTHVTVQLDTIPSVASDSDRVW